MKRFPSIKKNSEYRKIYKNGKSRAAGSLIMYVADNETDANRLGISVSKKVGNSVVRHTFCRKMREIFRLNDYRTVQGKDIIVVARSMAGRASYEKLEKNYLRLLQDHNISQESNQL